MKVTLASIVCCILTANLYSQHGISFNNWYQYDSSRVTDGTVVPTGSGYIVMSNSHVFPPSQHPAENKLIIGFVDSLGSMLSYVKHKFEPDNPRFNSRVRKGLGEEYWICGQDSVGFGPDSNIAGIVFRFSAQGDSIFYTRSEGLGKVFYDIIPLDDGYIVTGLEYDSVHQKQRTILERFDVSGNLLWERMYTHANSLWESFGYYVFSCPDGGFVITGGLKTGADIRGLVIKTDSIGEPEWIRDFDRPEPVTYCHGFMSSDGFIHVQMTQVKNPGSYFPESTEVIAKLTLENELVWEREFGPAIIGRSPRGITEDADGNLVSADYIHLEADSVYEGGICGHLMKTSPNGDSLCSLTFKHKCLPGLYDNYNDVRSIEATAEGGVVTCGFVMGFDSVTNELYQDVWVVKFESDWCNDDTSFSCAPITIVDTSNSDSTWSIPRVSDDRNLELSVWPNPNDGSFQLAPKLIQDLNNISIHNAHGHEVFFELNPSGRVVIKRPVPGLYIIHMSVGEVTMQQKIIVKSL